jgi:uncharacterized membrane protein YidH (DUF202 family)
LQTYTNRQIIGILLSGFFMGTKQSQRKLLGVTVIGLSAWLLVIGLVLFDHTTKAMFTGDPVPSAETTASSSSSVLGTETSVPHTTAQVTRPTTSDRTEMYKTLLAGSIAIAIGISVTIAFSLLRYKKRTSTESSS